MKNLREKALCLALLLLCTLLLPGCGQAKEKEPTLLESSLAAEMREALLPTLPFEQTQEPLPEEYAAQRPEEELRTLLLENYLEDVRMEVMEQSEGSVQITLTTPDLAAVLAAVREDDNSNSSASAMQARMIEILLSGDCPQRSQTLTLATKTNSDGSVSIEETEEYWDALYGGLLSYSRELMAALEG